jgi:hypothetical protein
MKPRSIPIKVKGSMLTPRGPTDRVIGKLNRTQTLQNSRIIQRLPGGRTIVNPMRPGQKRVKQIPRVEQKTRLTMVHQKPPVQKGFMTRIVENIFRTSNKSARLGQKVGQRVIKK